MEPPFPPCVLSALSGHSDVSVRADVLTELHLQLAFDIFRVFYWSIRFTGYIVRWCMGLILCSVNCPSMCWMFTCLRFSQSFLTDCVTDPFILENLACLSNFMDSSVILVVGLIKAQLGVVCVTEPLRAHFKVVMKKLQSRLCSFIESSF